MAAEDPNVELVRASYAALSRLDMYDDEMRAKRGLVPLLSEPGFPAGEPIGRAPDPPAP